MAARRRKTLAFDVGTDDDNDDGMGMAASSLAAGQSFRRAHSLRRFSVRQRRGSTSVRRESVDVEGTIGAGDTPARGLFRTSSSLRQRDDAVFATVAAMMEEANSRMSNDFLEAWNTQALNVAQAPAAVILHLNERRMERIHRCWTAKRGSAQGVDMRTFVSLLAWQLVRIGAFDDQGARVDMLRKDIAKGNSKTFLHAASFRVKTSGLFHSSTSASGPPAMAASIFGAVEETDSDESSDTDDDVEGTEAGFTVDRLRANSELVTFLCDLYQMVDSKRVGRVTWDDFVTFVIERIYSHSLQRHGPSTTAITTDEADLKVNPVTGTRCTLQYMGQVELAEPEGQQWVHGMRYFPAWDAVVALSHATAAVYMIEDINSYLLDVDAAAAGDIVRRNRRDANVSWAKRKKLLRQQAELARKNPWFRGTMEDVEPDVCKATYLHSPATINCCEYFSSIGVFGTVSNAMPDQLALYSVHLRKDVRFARRVRVPLPANTHISLLRDYASTAPLNLGGIEGVSGAPPVTRMPDADDAISMFGTRDGYAHYFAMAAELSRKTTRHAQLPYLGSHRIHSDEITDAIVLPRSGRVVTTSLDCTVAVHHPGDGKLSSYTGHDKGVYTVAYSNAFEAFITGVSSTTLCVGPKTCRTARPSS